MPKPSAATVFASIVIPVVVLAIGTAWAGVVEIIKLAMLTDSQGNALEIMELPKELTHLPH